MRRKRESGGVLTHWRQVTAGRLAGRFGGCVGVCLCLILISGRLCWGGMDVMTNAELADIQGGDIQIDISNPGYYGAGDDTTVVRFAADIYTEVYAHVGTLRLGHYDRSSAEMGDMAVLHSSEIARFANVRSSPQTSWSWNTRIRNTTPATNFGMSTGPAWTQWDVSFEHLQLGSASHPFRMYGLVFRTEFSNWGDEEQELDRIVIGTNQAYGYASMRPLVTSGYLSFNLAHLTSGMGQLIATARMFQLTRDPMADMHWSMSSIHADPTTSDQDIPSTRELWFNTEMNDDVSVNKISSSTGPYAGGRFDTQMDDHGAFLSLDFTAKQFRGWNLLAGINEYEEWLNFGQTKVSPIIRREDLLAPPTGEQDY